MRRAPHRAGPHAGPALLAGALIALAACSDGDGPIRPEDRTPPQVTVVQPSEEAIVRSEHTSFVIRVADPGSGVFCPSLAVSVSGVDMSQAFLSGCDADAGEVRASNPVALEEGPNTLVVRISDQEGNTTTVTRAFTVETDTAPPPPP